jgi:calcineurin-like phosphoesterase family protein
MSTFKWLHISDWHQKHLDYDREVIARELLKDVERCTSQFSNINDIDVIIFSGDIAFSGKEIEYARADQLLIDPLLRKLKNVPIFFVPGNHDVDRDVVKKTLPEILDKLKSLSPDEREKQLAEPPKLSDYKAPLEEFYKFANRHGQRFSPDGLHSVKTIPLKAGGDATDHKTVALIGINSAWTSARYKLAGNYDGSELDVWDYGLLRTTEQQIRSAIGDAEKEKSEFNVIVMHHPIYWLHENEQARFEDLLGANARIFLHGHEHRPRVNTITGTFGDLVVVPAGALYERRRTEDFRHMPSYNFGFIDLSSYTGEIYLRRWSDAHDWEADDSYWRDGRIPFFIPRAVKRIEKRDVRRALVESQRRYLNRAYERGATKLDIHLNHAFETIGDEVFIRARIRYSYQLQEGPDKKFEFRLGPNNATSQHQNPEVNRRAFRILQIQVNGSDIDIDKVAKTEPKRNGGGITADESDQFIRYELTIPNGPVTVDYSYEILETLNGVWYFLANRFVESLEFTFEAPASSSGSPLMKYEPIPIGDFGPLTPQLVKPGVVLQAYKLCFPDQGYLIHWYEAKRSSAKRKVVTTKKKQGQAAKDSISGPGPTLG